MPKSTPIALLAILAVFVVALVPSASAVSTRSHRRTHAAHNAASHNTSPHAKTAHAVAQRSHASAHTGARRRVSSVTVSDRPRSRSAMRAHARIHADLVRRRRHGKLTPLPTELKPMHLSIPPPLRGSHESLVHQNQMAESEGLERILDDADLRDRIVEGALVPVPVTNGLQVNPELPPDRRYCRPWTAKFLRDLAAAHVEHFTGEPILVTSAVRTVEYQRHLRHINGNAAAADGDIASPHLTGSTIDIAKKGMSAREIGWMRAWLIPLEQAGKIDVEEEFKQACFHISVYKGYADPPPTHTPTKAKPLTSDTMLAVHGR